MKSILLAICVAAAVELCASGTVWFKDSRRACGWLGGDVEVKANRQALSRTVITFPKTVFTSCPISLLVHIALKRTKAGFSTYAENRNRPAGRHKPNSRRRIKGR